jgi:DNA polymerase (family X)
MKNRAIADMFDRIADILEFKGELSFRVLAYRKASRVIQDLRDDIESIWKDGKLEEIPGIGEGMAKKIDEYLSTGKMAKYEEVTKGVPLSLIDLLNVQGLGPKTLSLAHGKLKVKNLEDLKRVIADGSLAKLPRMGEKKVENINKGIRLFVASHERMSLGIALPVAERVIEELKKAAKVKRISTAGSLRRLKETIGDIDILSEGMDGEEIIKKFTSLPSVERVLASGETKGSIIVEGGTQVDLRVVEPGSYGAALQYFTGSKDHNVKLREIAKKQGLKINEYGVFRGESRIGGKNEEEIYKAVGIPMMAPELREDRGEIEAAIDGTLPDLVTSADIKGDFHVHSVYSDGSDSITAIAEKGVSMGYSFVAICDHSKSARYAGGMNEAALLKQIAEIRKVNSRLKGKGFQLLAGVEVDIKADGSLDFPDELLKKLDLVVASIHSGFKQRVTERIVSAMKNPLVHIIGHPTGRLISRREGYEVDLGKVMEAAKDRRTALEINAYHDRLDLSDIACRKAKELGITLAIGTDSHSIAHLDFMKFGLAVARRGWLEKPDLLNSLGPRALLARLKGKAKAR